MNKEIDPNELWDILDEDELIGYQEDFNIYDDTDLRSELSLGIGHLIKASRYSNDYLDEIEEDIKSQHFLDNHDPTEEEIESMIKPRK